MYTRVPQKKTNVPQSPERVAISLPENYSGIAFTEDGRKREYQSDIAPNREIVGGEKKAPHISPSAPAIIPSFSSIPPMLADEQEKHREKAHDDTTKNEGEITLEHTQKLQQKEKPSIANSLFPKALSGDAFKNNFPFGHGIGSEELLLLGIMMSIYLLGEADGELMLILCVLLFSG